MMYSSIEKADAYFSGKIEKERWNALEPEQKQQALVNASENIDLFASLNGGFKAFIDDLRNTPPPITDLCNMEALYCFEESKSERAKLQSQGVTSINVGGVSESYKGADKQEVKPYSYCRLPLILKPFLRGQAIQGVII